MLVNLFSNASHSAFLVELLSEWDIKIDRMTFVSTRDPSMLFSRVVLLTPLTWSKLQFGWLLSPSVTFLLLPQLDRLSACSSEKLMWYVVTEHHSPSTPGRWCDSGDRLFPDWSLMDSLVSSGKTGFIRWKSNFQLRCDFMTILTLLLSFTVISGFHWPLQGPLNLEVRDEFASWEKRKQR